VDRRVGDRRGDPGDGAGCRGADPRYRLTKTGGALQRTGWVVFVLLLLIYSAWVLVVGVTFLFYAD
jgi:hypothetical protein